MPRRAERRSNARSVSTPARGGPAEDDNEKEYSQPRGGTGGDRDRNKEHLPTGILASSIFSFRVSKCLLITFRFLFFLAFAFDTWKQLERAYKYGFGEFNITHLPLAIEHALVAYVPITRALLLPTPAVMIMCWMLMTFLSLRAAIGLSRPYELWMLALLDGYAYFVSQLNLYQHEYLLCLLLFIFTQFEPITFGEDEKDDPENETGVFGKVKSRPIQLILAQVAIVYFWTGVAKVDPAWLEGHLLPRLVSPRTNLLVAQAVALLVPGNQPDLLEWTVATFWLLLSTFVCLFEFILVGLFLLFPASERMKWFLFPAGIGLHLGMEASGLQIGRFSYFMMLLYLPLLPSFFDHWLCRFFQWGRMNVGILYAWTNNLFYFNGISISLHRVLALLLIACGDFIVWKSLPFPSEITVPVLLMVSTLVLMSDILQDGQGESSATAKKRNGRRRRRNGRGEHYQMVTKGALFLSICLVIVLFEATTMQFRGFHKGAAHSYLAMGRHDEGIAHYETFIEYYGKETEHAALAELGIFLERRSKAEKNNNNSNSYKDQERAVECFKEALAFDPNNLHALVGLMNHHQRVKEREEVCALAARVQRRAEGLVREECGYWEVAACEQLKGFAGFVLKGVPQTKRQFGC